MDSSPEDPGRLLEIEDLRLRLEDAEEVLRAIRGGRVDAIVVQGRAGDQVFTLNGADQPYRLLIQAMNEGALLLSIDGNVLYANRSFASLLGRPLEELIGTPFDHYLHPDTRGAWQGLSSAARTSAVKGELRVSTAGGAEVPVYLSAAPVTLDDLPSMAVVVTNLTEQRRAEAILLAQKRASFLGLASRILDESLDASRMLDDLVGHCTESLADWCEIVLLEREGDTICRTLVCRSGGGPGSRSVAGPTPSQAALRVFATRKCELHLDVSESMLGELVAEDGAMANLRRLGSRSIITVPMMARQQTLGAITLAGRGYGADDLALAQDLGYRAALAFDNARLYRRAQEAVQAREEFLSIASHELKTPLSTLQLQTQLLLVLAERKEGGLSLSAEHVEMLKKIERQSDRLTDLINNLLDVSRITSGTLQLNIEDVDLRASAFAAAGRLDEQLKRNKIEVTVHADRPLPGRWDRLRLEQMITNLLTNAIKYGNGNPITVTVHQEGSKAILKVEDRGIGIPPDAVAKMFTRFRRFVPLSYAGLGLGLYIVRQIVEAHGGSIRVASEVGRGSTFTVELPLSGEAVPRSPDPEAHEGPHP